VKTTYSGLATNWDGFRPVVYSLGERALSLPLKATKSHAGQQTGEETSIAKLLEALKDNNYQVEDDLVAVNITTEAGSLRLQGPTFNCKLAGIILELRREGIKPFASEWFWYDTDESDTDPTVSYSFFVADGDNIVRESVSFLDYSGSGFDPAVFDSVDDSSDSDWFLARAAYWYRRFYRETRIGQLMVLRPSMPVLHYFPDGRPWYKLTASVASNGLLRHIPFLLWIVVALLAAITFLLIRK
jgi:hypothetical protein